MRLVWITEKLAKYMHVISGYAITFILLLTGADVLLRTFGHPIIGTFELVGLAGAVVIGFAIPMTSWTRGHISVDALTGKLGEKGRNAINILTRILSVAIFFLIGYNLIKYSYELFVSGEVTLTRHLPFYPIGYGLAVCCFIQCLVMICDIIKIFGGKYE